MLNIVFAYCNCHFIFVNIFLLSFPHLIKVRNIFKISYPGVRLFDKKILPNDVLSSVFSLVFKGFHISTEKKGFLCFSWITSLPLSPSVRLSVSLRPSARESKSLLACFISQRGNFILNSYWFSVPREG